MNEAIISHHHRAVNLISKSLGLMPIDETNEYLYERDDLRKFHIPVTETREGFVTVLAASHDEAATKVQESFHCGNALEGTLERLEFGEPVEG